MNKREQAVIDAGLRLATIWRMQKILGERIPQPLESEAISAFKTACNALQEQRGRKFLAQNSSIEQYIRALSSTQSIS